MNSKKTNNRNECIGAKQLLTGKSDVSLVAVPDDKWGASMLIESKDYESLFQSKPEEGRHLLGWDGHFWIR